MKRQSVTQKYLNRQKRKNIIEMIILAEIAGTLVFCAFVMFITSI